MFQRKSLISLFSLAALLLLSACGFHPLYVAGGDGPVYQALQDVKVGVIADRRGQILRKYLLEELQAGTNSAKYTLNVQLEEATRKLAFRKDETPRHEEVEIVAHIELIDEETGKVEYRDRLQAVSSFSLGARADLASYSADVAQDRAKELDLKLLSQNIKLSVATYLAGKTSFSNES